MGILFSYSLIASLFVVLLYPVGRLVVNRSTDFRFNRIFLLVLMGLSVILPLWLSLTGGPATPQGATTALDGMTESFFGPLDGKVENSAPVWVSYVLPAIIIYTLGVLMLIIRETVSYFRLYNILRRSEKKEEADCIICHLRDERISPFSWGKYMFLSATDCMEISDEVFLHEKSHIAHRHWIDLLISEIICIFLWYNPFAWKMRRLVKLNHEFQADRNVIASGVNPYHYQRLLLSVAMDRNVMGMANCFGSDRRGFRERVLAIGRMPSSRKVLLISLWALPALAAGFFVASITMSARVMKEISEVASVSSTTLRMTEAQDVGIVQRETEDRMVEFEGGENALYSFLTENIVYPETSGTDGDEKHTVKLLFDITKEGKIENIRVKKAKGSVYEEEAIRVLKLTDGKWLPAVKDGRKVDSSMQLPFYFMKK